MSKYLFILLIATSLTLNVKSALIHTSGNGNWSSTTTWTGGALPLTTDDVQVDNNDEITISVGDSYSVSEIWMGNNSILNIDGDLTIDSLHINNNATLNVTGTLTINGGISISNNADLTINATGDVDVNGDITAANGTSLTVNGDLDVVGDVTFDKGGTITVGDSGTIDIDGNLDTGSADIEGTGPISVTETVTGTNADDSQVNSTLPIELLSFSVSIINNLVNIEWTTATEINNNYFTVQKSTDGVNYNNIATVCGAGNSNYSLNYSYTDNAFNNPVIYYRLMQTDFNGHSKVFSPKSVRKLNNNNITKLKVYPNPVSLSNSFSISSNGFHPNESITISIMSQEGYLVNQFSTNTDTQGSVNESINNNNYKKGIYFVRLTSKSNQIIDKLIIN